ncbi:MAG: hypothetical protein K1X72_27155 [Pyrinomonadaceae bacterium]|nr:hypothetical protein [Pyrinomonadaceae bacterium]
MPEQDGFVTHLLALARNLVIIGIVIGIYFYCNNDSWQWFLEFAWYYKILIVFIILFLVNALTVGLLEFQKFIGRRL